MCWLKRRAKITLFFCICLFFSIRSKSIDQVLSNPKKQVPLEQLKGLIRYCDTLTHAVDTISVEEFIGQVDLFIDQIVKVDFDSFFLKNGSKKAIIMCVT